MKESRMDRIERGLEEFFRVVMEDRKANAIANAELRTSIAELRESQKKTDEQLKKTAEQLRKTSKKVEEVSKKLGEMGIIDGKVAEDLFYRNVQHVFEGKISAFSDVRRNVKKKGFPGEYDIVAVK